MSPEVCVFDVHCWAPKAGWGDEELCLFTEIIVPRRGVFVSHRHGHPVVADCNTALVLQAGDVQRVSHPTDAGDECTALAFAPELLDQALRPETARHGRLRPTTQLGVRLLTSALSGDGVDRLQAEEAALLLLDALSADLGSGPLPAARRIGRVQWARVEEVRSLLAADPAFPWSMDAIAKAVHCSSFHLARQFRAISKESLHHYLVRLRLGLALERLAGGESDLARLAGEVGFSNHSHFSASFRVAFGSTPSAVRGSLSHSRLGQMRTILTAKPRSTV